MQIKRIQIARHLDINEIIRKVLFYALLLAIILQCHSLMDHVYKNSYFLIAILGIWILLLGFSKRLIFRKWNLGFSFIYLIFLSVLVIIGDFKHIEFLFSVMFCFALFMIYLSDADRVDYTLKAFSNIIVVISIISLFFFIFASILKIIPYTNVYSGEAINWGSNHYDYFHLYNESQWIDVFSYSGVRNIGPFVEAPMFNYVLCLALYYELFLNRANFRKVHTAILIVTLITTFSTTGLISAIILLIIIYYSRMKKWIQFILLPAILALCIIIAYIFVQDKVNNNFNSTSVRMDDIQSCIKCFLDNFWIGAGYENMSALRRYRFLNVGDTLSSGLSGILAFGGVLLGFWYVFPIFIAIIRFIKNKNRSEMGWILFTSLLLVFTVVQTRVLCTMVNAISWIYIFEVKQDSVQSMNRYALK